MTGASHAPAREKRSADSAAQTARDAMEALSSKLAPVLSPIWQDAGIHRLRIAPDGMLNLVPFSALSDEPWPFPDGARRDQLCLRRPRPRRA